MKRILLIFVILFCLQGIIKSQEKEIISRLASASQPLDRKEPDFSGLESILNNKKIIALGEGTHGTKEFEELYSSLVRFVVEKLGYRVIAFEADFMACQAINDYVTYKIDSMDYRRLSGFPDSKDKTLLFEWLREWNGTLSEDETPVEVFGLEVRNLSGAIGYVIERCSKLGIDASTLQPFVTTETSQFDRTAYQEAIAFLEQLLQVESGSIDKIDRHMMAMSIQTLTHQLRLQTAFNKRRHIGIRDRSMFENTCWILDDTSHENLILWAHSGHVAKSDIFGEDPTGKYLHDRYQNGYIAIGSTFGSGDVNLFTKVDGQYRFGHREFELPTKGDYYEYYFDRVNQGTLFIDLEKATKDKLLQTFFNKKRAVSKNESSGLLEAPPMRHMPRK